MQRRRTIAGAVTTVGFVALTAVVFAQQAPQPARGAAPAPAAPQGQGAGRAAAAAGRGAAAEAATRPALLWKEEWKQPPYTGDLNDENRRVTQDAVTNPRLELKLYGTAVKEIGVYNHEGRFDLWSGMATSPVAVTLRDKANFVDLTGLARLRWTVRTQSLHTVYPVVKLADGTMIAGSRGISTEGDFIVSEVAYSANMKWYKLDPVKVVTTVAVPMADLTKVDEVGWVDLAPSGGHGNAGWHNVSAIELYAKPVPR